MKKNKKYNKKHISSTATLYGFIAALLLAGCSAEEPVKAVVPKEEEQLQQPESEQEQKRPEQEIEVLSVRSIKNPEGMNIVSRFSEPEGYERITVSEESFAEFVRNYPLKPDGSPVFLYDAKEKGNQSAHAAVFDMHLEPEDFQQCADSVMRIYTEYFYQREEYDRIGFHLVNGFLFDFDTWRKGNGLSVDNNETVWKTNSSNDSTQTSLERYLHMLFAYASTLSMEKESEDISLSQIDIGDIFIKGGSPGHVVMVADICENEQGEKAVLLAQGYMPAQEFHILVNPADKDNPWYYAEDMKWPLQTPEYTFQEGSLKRPFYLQDAENGLDSAANPVP